jgi:hypothetical protein
MTLNTNIGVGVDLKNNLGSDGGTGGMAAAVDSPADKHLQSDGK